MSELKRNEQRVRGLNMGTDDIWKFRAFTAKDYLHSIVSANKELKKMKEEYKRGSKYICPECKNMVKGLTSAHVDKGVATMVNELIEKCKKNRPHISHEEFLELVLKEHNKSVLRVCCMKCNHKCEVKPKKSVKKPEKKVVKRSEKNVVKKVNKTKKGKPTMWKKFINMVHIVLNRDKWPTKR
tara:strand:+ start:8524 stop:9072 length:549 start_codon:yes stop_codon:yes gene_type:complete